MYFPPLDEFKAKTGRGNLVPVYREIMADLETPVSAFLKLDRGDYSFLLESVEGGEKWGRYCFLGSEPLIIFLGSTGWGRPTVATTIVDASQPLQDVAIFDPQAFITMGVDEF